MKLNFIHIPKTAGLTFYYFLEECFGAENCYRAGDKDQVTSFHSSRSLDYFDNFTVVAGHLKVQDFVAKNLVKPGRLSFAFLRSPLQREISAFRYYLDTPYYDRGDKRPMHSSNVDLVDFYFAKCALGATQSSYFGDFINSIDLLTEIERLKIFLFPVEHLAAVAAVVKNYAKVDFFPACRVNENKSGALNEDEMRYLTIVASNFVETNLYNDVLLYRTALDKFSESVKRFELEMYF